ncbi:hypothetical protein ASO20_00410 [Mycoplasma sp. (ex Biomphalaria glabrata)]|uniref:hypothetical protein n=1 Tax=Mycoplasma sp. (ex Biomphalaria glabrata) TaxID=1749074 RepID=UPI00073AA21E|nr:hypothetical protein [Mycoplasma sp. (ex Biomphalaria glabrata)]ALV23144.1 hypothetical protein ASO20_00410 [Mycoplasma sp. (ex Biomphalaria glabrata)]
MKKTLISLGIALSSLLPTAIIDTNDAIKQVSNAVYQNQLSNIFGDYNQQVVNDPKEPAPTYDFQSSNIDPSFYPIQKELNLFLWYAIIPTTKRIAQTIYDYDPKMGNASDFVSSIMGDIGNYNPTSQSWNNSQDKKFSWTSLTATNVNQLPESPYTISQQSPNKSQTPKNLDFDRTGGNFDPNSQDITNGDDCSWLLSFKTSSNKFASSVPLGIFGNSFQQAGLDTKARTLTIDANTYSECLKFNLYLLTDYFFAALTKEFASKAGSSTTDANNGPMSNYFNQLFRELSFSGAEWFPNPWFNQYKEGDSDPTHQGDANWANNVINQNYVNAYGFTQDQVRSYINLWKQIPVTPTVASFVWSSMVWTKTTINQTTTPQALPEFHANFLVQQASGLSANPSSSSYPTAMWFDYAVSFSNPTNEPVDIYYVSPTLKSNQISSIQQTSTTTDPVFWQEFTNTQSNILPSLYIGNVGKPYTAPTQSITTYFDQGTGTNPQQAINLPTLKDSNVYQYLFFMLYLGYNLAGNSIASWIPGANQYSSTSLTGVSRQLLSTLGNQYLKQRFVKPADDQGQIADTTNTFYATFQKQIMNWVSESDSEQQPTNFKTPENSRYIYLGNICMQDFANFTWGKLSNELWGDGATPDKVAKWTDDPSYDFMNKDDKWKNNRYIQRNKVPASMDDENDALKTLSNDLWNFYQSTIALDNIPVNPTLNYIDQQGRSYQGDVVQYLQPVLNDISAYNALTSTKSYTIYIILGIIAGVVLIIFVSVSVVASKRIREYSIKNGLQY